MKTNIGKTDKVIRILIGIIIVGLYLEEQISGAGAVLLKTISAFLFVTSFFGYCPIYIPFGISTRKRHSDAVR